MDDGLICEKARSVWTSLRDFRLQLIKTARRGPLNAVEIIFMLCVEEKSKGAGERLTSGWMSNLVPDNWFKQ
ncbi:hypothetical protein DPEC_G00022550 [Dallia pectoralis]|uniref:Uncharacterized protein n=1 Tax=Dallia pectoralis TaxID=75939 RepID=A0ACC2HGK2_DALPE|nr:hypothetical protein DPEC_G00022550 [Dallia pectoralis]